MKGGGRTNRALLLLVAVLVAGCSASQGGQGMTLTAAPTTVRPTPSPTPPPPAPSSMPPTASSAAPSAASSSAVPTRSAEQIQRAWQAYPWAADDGLACLPPATSGGISTDPAAPGVVVVVGDSLIRESRWALDQSLHEAGYQSVFVCWGGKTLEWGMEQVDVMRSLGLTPSCLVINLGTNDLKGTTAQGLADAVPLATVSDRLTRLLQSVSDIPDVFVVDLAADLSIAPSTMSEVGDAPSVWQSAVDTTGVGAVVPWSSIANEGGLIGGDGIHDSADGQWARAQLITQYVERDCSA